jgi:hypothetical protein
MKSGAKSGARGESSSPRPGRGALEPPLPVTAEPGQVLGWIHLGGQGGLGDPPKGSGSSLT